MVKLSLKQKRFCDEYIITGNATQSALTAGYSKKTACGTGCENLTKPAIREYIDIRLKQLDDNKIAKADEVMKLLTAMARGEITEEILIGVGGGEQIKARVSVAAKERIKAAELLGKRYALWTERIDINGEIGLVKIVDDIANDDN